MKYPTVFVTGPVIYQKAWEEKGGVIFRCRYPNSAMPAGFVVTADDTGSNEAFHRFHSFGQAYFSLTHRAWAVPPEILDLREELDGLT
jgi:hypothetical protein